jgi:hypothetical protein
VLGGTYIPSQIGLMTSLTVLQIGNLFATGAIPTQIGRLTLLKELYININQFTGTLPTQVTALTRLTNFLISDNRLAGTVPPLPPSLSNLYSFHNRFSGPLVATGLRSCDAQRDSESESNCFVDLPSVCAMLPTQIAFANGSSTPVTFRSCLNSTDGSVFALPTSYVFSPPTSSLFAIDVAPATNVSLLLNDTVLTPIGAATALFFTTKPVAIGVRPPSTTAKPTITIRACSCDGNSAAFPASLLSGSDWLVALSVNASLAVQASLRPGRRLRGLFCAPAKHHYAVGVRAGTVVLKFDRFSIFSTGARLPVAQTAVSIYLVPASGGSAISRVVELNTSAPMQPADVHLSPAVALAEEAVLVIAASMPLMYAVSFTLADCLMGDDSTQPLVVGMRTTSIICPAGDRDTFSAAVQAGNFTLTVDIGGQQLSAPLVLTATLSVFENAQQRNVTAQPVCILEPFVAYNVSSCSWSLEQSDGLLLIELTVDNNNMEVFDYGVTLAFVPKPTAAPTPASLSNDSLIECGDERNRTQNCTQFSTMRSMVAIETMDDSEMIYVVAGVTGAAACLCGVGLVVLVDFIRRHRRAAKMSQLSPSQQQQSPSQQQPQALSMTELTSVTTCVPDDDASRGSQYVSTAQAVNVSAPSTQAPKRQYASSIAEIARDAKPAYDQLLSAECNAS